MKKLIVHPWIKLLIDSLTWSVERSNVPPVKTAGIQKLLTSLGSSEGRFHVMLAICLLSLLFLPTRAFATTPPIISPGTGVFFPGPTVSLSASSGTIFYTLDGSTPNTNSAVYSSSFGINATTTVNAIAVSGGVSSDVATANIVVDPNIQIVQSLSVTPYFWFRSDVGVVSDSLNRVSSWMDLSGSGNDATQSNTSDQPTLSEADWNGYPALAMDSGKYFELPSFGDTISPDFYFVTKPLGTGNGVIIDIGNGAASDNITASVDDTDASFTVYDGSTPNSLTASDALVLGQYQSLGMSLDGFISVNGDEVATGSGASTEPVIRSNNHIGTDYSATSNFYIGGLLEVFALQQSTSRDPLETYFLTRYQLLNAVPTAPIISVPSSTLLKPTQVAIATSSSCVCRYTTDGTTPTLSSQIYTGPIDIYFSQTLNAISVQNGVTGSVSSATYTLDSERWPAPASGDSTPLQLNFQSPID